jgi:hypothetical protein
MSSRQPPAQRIPPLRLWDQKEKNVRSSLGREKGKEKSTGEDVKARVF